MLRLLFYVNLAPRPNHYRLYSGNAANSKRPVTIKKKSRQPRGDRDFLRFIH
jgi:hypothetical protein